MKLGELRQAEDERYVLDKSVTQRVGVTPLIVSSKNLD